MGDTRIHVEQDMTTIWLSFPPSLNSLFPGKVRRFKSKKYEEWIKENIQLLKSQTYDIINEPVSVSYRFGRPDKRKRDLDNLFKAPNDLLVSQGVISDDSLIHKISGEWADITGCEITITSLLPVP